MLSPLYMAEISSPETRGSLLALEQLSIVFGCVVGFWTGFLTRNGEHGCPRNSARLNYIAPCYSGRKFILANPAWTTTLPWDSSRFGGICVACFSTSPCSSRPKRGSSCISRETAAPPPFRCRDGSFDTGPYTRFFFHLFI